MSAKATGLVWDMPCPQEINGIVFKDYHKYVLLAYVDHADHFGKNIFPSVALVSRKTGYKDRNVQYITRDLEKMGILVSDGVGPRGTNRYYVPFDTEGAKIAPLQSLQGAQNENSLGAIPSGAIPSGANNAPELKEPKPLILNVSNEAVKVWEKLQDAIKLDLKRAAFSELKAVHPVSFENDVLTLAVADEEKRGYFQDHFGKTMNRAFPGILLIDAEVEFVVGQVAQ